ncbi:hypothetical protein SSX86_011233 [Deinandra increscens subsp. villosa]|uniref:Ribosomal protein eL8/eL30/eS12/Gadd45 domain-containing protein n=1 Tax=Deinandra increscens subsp. villosa TaxID=3103831 RepID=A0AAP0H3B9_9ASTR
MITVYWLKDKELLIEFTDQCKMRVKNRDKSSEVLHEKAPSEHIFRPPNSYEGESLLHLLNSIQREMKSVRLAGESLPYKIWLKQQFSIGVNEVTRVLERMTPVHGSITAPQQNGTYFGRNAKQPPLRLQAILIATDCNPRGLTKHLPILGSSREVPVIYVKDKAAGGSFKLGEIVSLKTAMAIGVKARGNSINKVIDEILGDNNDAT